MRHFLDRRGEYETPEFLAWTLEFSCALRDIEGANEPDRVERQLRPLRELSVARREGRVCEGVVLPPDWRERVEENGGAAASPLGFFAHETLQAYGGEEAIAAQCEGCPANALDLAQPGAWAGCYGWLHFEAQENARDAVLAVAARRVGIVNALREAFLPTTPLWRGLWAASPLTQRQVELLQRLIVALGIDALENGGLKNFLAALVHASDHGLPLHVALTPAGMVRGRDWRLPPHCQRCKTPRPPGDPRCSVCGLGGGVAPERKRKARGLRPYEPLTRLLGPARTEAILQRCLVAETSRTEEQSNCLNSTTRAAATEPVRGRKSTDSEE